MGIALEQCQIQEEKSKLFVIDFNRMADSSKDQYRWNTQLRKYDEIS